MTVFGQILKSTCEYMACVNRPFACRCIRRENLTCNLMLQPWLLCQTTNGTRVIKNERRQRSFFRSKVRRELEDATVGPLLLPPADWRQRFPQRGSAIDSIERFECVLCRPSHKSALRCDRVCSNFWAWVLAPGKVKAGEP